MAALRGRFRALSNNRDLRRFVVQATPTGIPLGNGSFGSVEEVMVSGLLCAAKRIHEILLDAGNVGVEETATKYVEECRIMSNLRHPNITQFIGLCFLPNCQLPLLVMERLEGSLDDLLETISNIPLALKRSFLEDTARGLLYLHNQDPQIIHRDLTAKNVLLTSSLVAKITDFGNSRIINIEPGQLAQTLSRNPGTLSYMPLEALTAPSRYGPSLDIFSFGHLGIFVGLQVFPGNLLEPTHTDQGRLLARSEVDRRRNYINQLNYQLPKNGQHPFVQLVTRCLENEPHQRPTAEELITSLVEMKADIEGPYGEIAKIDAVRQVAMMRALRKKDTERSDESAAKDLEIQRLQQELEIEQAERTRAEEQLHHVTAETRAQLQQRDGQVQWAENQILEKDNQIRQNEAELEQSRTQLRQRDVQIQQNEAELEQSRTQLRQKDAQIQQNEAKLKQTRTQLRQKNARIQQNEAELEETRTQLRQKDAQIQQNEAELEQSRTQLRQKDAQIQQNGAKFKQTRTQLRQKNARIQQNEAELEETRTQLQEKDSQLQLLQKNVQIFKLYHTIVQKQNESRQARTQIQPSLQRDEGPSPKVTAKEVTKQFIPYHQSSDSSSHDADDEDDDDDDDKPTMSFPIRIPYQNAGSSLPPQVAGKRSRAAASGSTASSAKRQTQTVSSQSSKYKKRKTG